MSQDDGLVPPSPEMPQSNALVEARVESLSELMSRDATKMVRADRDRIVNALREQRARWELTEGGAKKPKASRVVTPLAI